MLISSGWDWFVSDACAQLSVNALRRELRGEPYAGKPHVRFGEGGVSFGSPPTSMDFVIPDLVPGVCDPRTHRGRCYRYLLAGA